MKIVTKIILQEWKGPLKASLLLLVCLVANFACVSSGDLYRVESNAVNRIEDLEKSLAEQQKERTATVQELRRMLAEQGAELDSLKGKMRELRGALAGINDEVSAYRELKTEVGVLGDKLNQFHNRLSISESNIAGMVVQQAAIKQNSGVILTQTGNATLEAIGKNLPREEGRKLYDKAYSLFKNRKFDRSRAEFTELLKRFPNSEYSADATFWMAESYFLEKQYEKAILEYESVIKDFPKSTRVASAMLKQGMSFLGMEDKPNATIIFRQTALLFPNTPQAKSAEQHLKSLK
ncbi:MAG: tol-pal system protein YbgF [Deltaproteobacteria bacterium]|nr:tol-pal system protein YbgF [Deltaproteobacteria bacterium]